MLAILKNVFFEMNEKVRYAHFKSNEHLCDSLEGKTDFDFLIDKNSSSAFEMILLNNGFKRCRAPKHSDYPGVDDWIGLDKDSGKLVHFHTHYQLVTGQAGYKNYVLPWHQIVLDTRVFDKNTGVYLASPEYELLQTYVRFVCKKSLTDSIKASWFGTTIGGDTKKEIEWLLERIDRDRLSELSKTLGEDIFELYGKGIFGIIDFRAHEYKKIKKTVKRSVSIHERSSMRFVKMRSWVWKNKSRLLGRIKRSRFCPGILLKKTPHDGGIIVSFVGVDGSGKSTVTKEITKWLSWKYEVSYVALGIGREKSKLSYRIKSKLLSLRRRKKTVGSLGTSTLKENKPIKKTFKNTAKQRSLLRFSKAVNKDLKRINSYRLNGGIVVTDRYPQTDFWGISDGPKISCNYHRYAEKEKQNLSLAKEIHPDIVFKLCVPPEVSMERRPNDDPEVLKRKIEILESINFNGAEIITIDATMPLDEEIRQIKRIIWDRL